MDDYNDDFWNNLSTTGVDEYAPNPSTPPKLRRFTAKRFGVPVSGVLAPKDMHPDEVFIWRHDADGFAINEAVERDSLTELKFLDRE